jgi:hypothetical protein
MKAVHSAMTQPAGRWWREERSRLVLSGKTVQEVEF